ncbi:MAG: bifunctional precorrin-2 dehydrogenase/sirohydrochlorin ferrochelatase [FCB group bacterium]|jgi:precorrin-2 dehydrogenase/sirohydrochlorin ferrochelatase|nr:bifunctional precorrin-2 dehydrogenase/sirohydrochlorin ferrochelatase [FCB group bacterium]
MTYPIFIKLEGRPCLIVGGGKIALGKALPMLSAGARLTVVSPKFLPEFEALQNTVLRHRPFEPNDMAGAFLAVAATDDPAVNRAVAEACRANGILCNVVDAPDLCDFHVPSVLDRGPLAIAISTAGEAPALAKRLRRDLEDLFPEDYADYVGFLGWVRERVRERATDRAVRERIAAEFASREGYERFKRATPAEREAWVSERVAGLATGDERS